MFGFDPAHTPQLELFLKGDYRKGISAQRYIVVANAFDWVDTNADGLGDSWVANTGTLCSIVTGNGFAGRAQRVDAGTSTKAIHTASILVVKGGSYRLRFRWRSGNNLQVRLGTTTYLSLGTNTGNAIFYDAVMKATTSTYIQFQVSTGDYIEISEVELWEVTPGRLWDEGRNRNIHGILYSGKALTFGGVSSYMDCGNPASLQVTTAFSICFWVKFATNSKVILSKDDAGSNRAFQIYKDSNGKLNFITISGTTVSTLVETTSSIDDEIWHRIVCTYDGSTKAIYVDGSLSISGPLSGAINNAAVNLFIGKLGNNTAYLSGSLSDVQIWGKAMSAADILFDFQYPEKPAWQRTGTSLTATDLKGHWWLCDNYGYYAFDYSGNQNDGALYGLTFAVQQKDIPQLALGSFSQKVFCTIDTVLRVSDVTPLRSIWNNGGKLSIQIMPYSDGESDLGTIVTKTSWLLRCEGESAGKVKLRFIVLFSTTNGEWVTTNTEVPLKQFSTVSVEYNSASSANTPVIKVNGTAVSLTTASAPSGTYTADSGSLLYFGDNAASSAAFEGLIDSIQLYNSNVLKGAWNNEGIYRWSDLSGNNNLLSSSTTNKELFLLPSALYSNTDILNLPLNSKVVRHGLNIDLKSYFECGIAPGINFNAATEDFSVSFWVCFARLAAGATEILISFQTNATSGFCLFIDGSFHLQATLNALKASATTVLNDINWHFIVCTVDRDDKMRMYIDGSEVTYSVQDNLASAAMTNTLNLRFGARSYILGNQLKGQMAGVTLHRKVLTSEEQKYLYAYGKSHYAS